MADEAKPAGKGSPTPAADEKKPADGQAPPAEGAKPAAVAAPAGDGEKPKGDPPAGAAPKADGTTNDGEKPKAGDKSAAAAVPDKYELTVPEGAEKWLGDEDLAQIAIVAKAQGWTNDQAQAALEEHADRLVAQSEQFRALTEADTEIGGEKLAATQALASRALDRIRPTTHARSDAFRKLLTKSGYGNHPEVIAFLADIGKLMKEDTAAPGGTTPTTKKSTAEKFYGKP